jgi:hypothetical protein
MDHRGQPQLAATALISQRFPQAEWALLAGSVLTADRTAGSDLDIVVCLPEDPTLPYRSSLYWQGWPVELFVHDESSLDHYLAKDLISRRPVLHRMIATGVVVGGSHRGAARLRARCAAVLAEGPPALPAAELARLRYAVTDLLDDLVHSRDPAETTAIATALWLTAAELALHAGRHWIGAGKWLLRELRDLDAGLAQTWVASHGDPDAVAALARQMLDLAGGPLFDGYHSIGQRPSPAAASR